MDNQSNTQRNVIPRWRSLELTPTDELSPVKNLRVAVASGGAISRQLDANFSKTKNFEDAAELVESSVSIGNTQRTLSAAKLLQGLQSTPQPLRKLATQLIQKSTIIHVAATESVVDLETLQRTSRNRIQVLKT